MTKFIYVVYYGDEAPQFESEVEAMEFARTKDNARVEKVETSEDGEFISSEVIWEGTTIEPQTKVPTEENPFETDFPESDINELSSSDDEAYGDWVDDEKLSAEFPFKEAVEKLEENEDEVECKVCFELGPKAEMKKLDIGYVCPKCAQEMQSHQGTNLDLIDSDPYDLEYDDPRDFDKPEDEEVLEEPVDANEVREHEQAIKEDLKIITDFSSYKPWSGAVDIYELIRDANKLEDLEAYLEELYPEGIDETQLNDILWFDGDQILRDLGLGDVEEDEDLDEHINDRPADIESDQELQGTDNAVVDCKTHTLVAHSEDEKPVDCKMEKPALEEPLAGEQVDIKLNEEDTFKQNFESYNVYGEKLEERAMTETPFDSEAKVGDKIRIIHLEGEDNSYDGKEGEVEHIDGIGQLHGTWGGLAVIPGVDEFEIITENLEEAKKDDELPVDPEAVKLEVHNTLNNLVADEIEAINGYEEAKQEIIDAPIEHKDELLDTVDHITDEEKEHIDELIDATSEIPFDKEEAPAVEEPSVETPVEEEPLEQEFPEVEEELAEAVSEEKLTDVEDYLKDADHGSIDFEWENDYDFVNGSILWNKDKEIFEAGLSIYHASEDNNANNPDAHTDEEDYSANTIKELYNYLSEDFGEEFEKAFEEAVKPEDLKEEKAKPVGDKVLDYNKALAIANSKGKPVIYGYTNTSYNGKYFTLDTPIVCNSVSDETKKFRAQYKSAGTVYVAYPGRSFIESLREAADVNYVEYMHSYCNALEPHMDELRKIEDVEELKKAILDIVNEDPDVNVTEKKNKFVWLIKNKKWSSPANIMAYLDKAMAKAKSIEVKVDDKGELVKEDLDDKDPKETQFVFTPEEQKEYNCDEDGNVSDSYDQLCHCSWCGEVYPTSDMRHEVDFGWICSRCEDELRSHGGPLTFIENEELDK